MQGQFDTAALNKVKVTDPVIQKGDLISIIVYSDNPDATKIYNQPIIVSSSSSAGGGGTEGISQGISGSGSLTTPGYLVDENGNIEFQGLGLLHVEGFTRNDLKQLLE